MVLKVKDSDGAPSLAGINTTTTTLAISNDSTCTLRRMRCECHQMENWDSFPQEIPPHSKEKVKIDFVTKSDVDVNEDHGECSYQVVSPENTALAEVTISADASASKGLIGTFTATVRVRWGNLPNVFGVRVEPLDGNLGFKHNDTLHMTIKGSPRRLEGGEREAEAGGKTTEWMSADDLEGKVEIGDIIAADRSVLHHYGIAYRRSDDGKIVLAHLNGTAEDVISTFGLLNAAKEFTSSLKAHGGVAFVMETSIPDFASGDPVRVNNAYDHKMKPFETDVIVERIEATLGYRDYSAREFNCEHFVHLMRYGKTYSGQIEEMQRLDEKFAEHLREIGDEKLKHFSLPPPLERLRDDIEALRMKHKEDKE